MTLLLILEHDRGKWSEANDEALTAARTLAGDMGADIHAALIGEGALDLAGQAAAGGAAVVHNVTAPMLTDFGPEAYGESVVQLIAAAAPTAVMAVGTSRGNEVMAQVAARMDLPFVANCMTVTPGDGQWSMTRIQWGGSLLEDSTLDSGDGPKLLSFGHHAVAAEVAAAPGAPSHVMLSDTQAEHIPGCTLTVTRKAFETIGGFSDVYRVAGDDVDFCWRLEDAGALC